MFTSAKMPRLKWWNFRSVLVLSRIDLWLHLMVGSGSSAFWDNFEFNIWHFWVKYLINAENVWAKLASTTAAVLCRSGVVSHHACHIRVHGNLCGLWWFLISTRTHTHSFHLDTSIFIIEQFKMDTCMLPTKQSCNKESATFKLVSSDITLFYTLWTELKQIAQQHFRFNLILAAIKHTHMLKESYTTYSGIQTCQIQTGADHHQRTNTQQQFSTPQNRDFYENSTRTSEKWPKWGSLSSREECVVFVSVTSQPARPVPSGITNIPLRQKIILTHFLLRTRFRIWTQAHIQVEDETH